MDNSVLVHKEALMLHRLVTFSPNSCQLLERFSIPTTTRSSRISMKMARRLSQSGTCQLSQWSWSMVPTVSEQVYCHITCLIAGWSSKIPNHNPQDLIDNLRRLLKGEEIVPMLPWYRGFTGPIETTDKPGRYKVTGILKAIEDQSNMIEITELPVGMWTQEMKEFLEKEVMGTEKGPGMVKDYEEHHTTNTVHFKVQMTDKGMELARTQGLETTFKVVSYINTTNMVAFDAGGRIRKYNSPEDIFQDFLHLILEL
jgi:hypothetical protein